MERNELSHIPDRPKKNEEEKMAEYRSFKERAVPKVYFKRGDNNDLESSSSMHEQHQPNDTMINIRELEIVLGAAYNLKGVIHVPQSHCCIYKVPNDLRNINRQAYIPRVISIGPLHHGNKELIEMEKQKLRYMVEFKRDQGEEILKGLKGFIEVNEQYIRSYYQENCSLESHEFINMILLDAVFIIEFFLKNETPVDVRGFDFFLDTACVKSTIACDLQLLENQLPYILLQNLFEIAFGTPDRFWIISTSFFFGCCLYPKKEYEIQHFTDLRRYFLLMDFLPRDQKKGEHVRDLPIATKLHGSGVKFKCKKEIEGGSSLKISCEYVPRAMRIPGFKRCEIPIPFIKELKLQIPGFKGCEIPIPFIKELELQIPRFEIDDRSECLYRNMMALELCHYPSKTYICNFIVLMDFLINTEKDVDLFVDQKIIFSMLGDHAAVAKMFNNLGLQITPSHSVYHDIGEKLKEHYARPWNRTMATLNTVYFGDIWTGTATIAAVILLVLTFIQAVCSIRSLRS